MKKYVPLFEEYSSMNEGKKSRCYYISSYLEGEHFGYKYTCRSDKYYYTAIIVEVWTEDGEKYPVISAKLKCFEPSKVPGYDYNYVGTTREYDENMYDEFCRSDAFDELVSEINMRFGTEISRGRMEHLMAISNDSYKPFLLTTREQQLELMKKQAEQDEQPR